MTTTDDIAIIVSGTVLNIPEDITGSKIFNYVEEGKRSFQNYFNITIDSDDVPETYQNLLIYYGRMAVYGQMAGEGTSFDWKLGEFSKSSGEKKSNEVIQMDRIVDNINFELKAIGKSVKYKLVNE